MTMTHRTPFALAAGAIAVALSILPATTYPPEPEPLVVELAGDSLTDRYASLTDFDPIGWWYPGATSAGVLNYIQPGGDVLVLMVGTNDIREGISRTTTVANVHAIVDKVGAAHVVLLAVAPCDVTDDNGIDRQREASVLNRSLATHAQDAGWLFVDPWARIRTLDGGYASGMTTDGVHPTTAGAQIVADVVEGAVLIATEGAGS
ncbi:SGNH/GDSL hydrolase family protein [Actinotalea sp. M2MS4P-6]|uniref:SGNH/GDSL hydrolase family protein n=1 Tax=Actinotalea sp. M2MS4P-6 TaxID=2983762 RepID=UPI0021E44AD1|nr:SGNH/GDSL hydrolase family protein [Actinotalea sp. M2MS4P-6]MCV2395913.1 SGNH/GDSL hydrolase family protein [Actinotalea sp. M2MS4P-6]